MASLSSTGSSRAAALALAPLAVPLLVRRRQRAIRAVRRRQRGVAGACFACVECLASICSIIALMAGKGLGKGPAPRSPTQPGEDSSATTAERLGIEESAVRMARCLTEALRAVRYHDPAVLLATSRGRAFKAAADALIAEAMVPEDMHAAAMPPSPEVRCSACRMPFGSAPPPARPLCEACEEPCPRCRAASRRRTWEQAFAQAFPTDVTDDLTLPSESSAGL